MKDSKTILKIAAIVISIALIGFLAYQAYVYILADATQRIKQNITSSINPLKVPGKIFGFGDKK